MSVTLTKLFDPRQYRRFMRWANCFFRLVPWLWCGGIGAVLAVAILRLDKHYGITLGLVCALAIWPVLLGWLGFNGVGIVWRFTLAVLQAMRRKQRPDSLGLAFGLSVLLAGVVFLWGAAMILSGLLRHALSHR